MRYKIVNDSRIDRPYNLHIIEYDIFGKSEEERDALAVVSVVLEDVTEKSKRSDDTLEISFHEVVYDDLELWEIPLFEDVSHSDTSGQYFRIFEIKREPNSDFIKDYEKYDKIAKNIWEKIKIFLECSWKEFDI